MVDGWRLHFVAATAATTATAVVVVVDFVLFASILKNA